MAMRPGANKIALVAYASTRDSAPFDKGGPNGEFEIWGCNKLYQFMPGKNWDRWFNVHDADYLKANELQHYEDLKTMQALIYMDDKHPDIPNSERYPFEQHEDAFGNYYTSSIAYMLGMALMECLDFATDDQRAATGMPFVHKKDGAKAIYLYGIHMASDEEYHQQRACCEFYLGIARGCGIAAAIPDESSLLKSPRRYGMHHGFDMARLIEADIMAHKQLKATRESEMWAIRDNMNVQVGIVKALEGVRKKWLWDEEKRYVQEHSDEEPKHLLPIIPEPPQGTNLADEFVQSIAAASGVVHADTLIGIIQEMPSDAVGLLGARIYQGMTYAQMGDHLKCTASVARKNTLSAWKLLHSIAKVEAVGLPNPVGPV